MFQAHFHLQSHLGLRPLQLVLRSGLLSPLLSTVESWAYDNIRFKEQKNGKNKSIGHCGVTSHY